MKENIKEIIIPDFIKSIRHYDNEIIENVIIDIYKKNVIKKEYREIEEKFNALGIKLDIEVVTYIFEALLEEEKVVENGIVFTPEYIASFISKLVIDEYKVWDENVKIIDPGCGCGIFLLSAINYIKNKYRVPVRDIIVNNIYGIDLELDNVRRCKKLLKMMVEIDGGKIEDDEIKIMKNDSLKENWNEVFNVQGFDLIIGNPPYVNTHDMNKETISFLKTNFDTTKTGVFNIFYAFIEHGMKFLKKKGKLGFIVPNNFLTIKSAVDLRTYIEKEKALSLVIDFADNMLFKPVRTYNCILILDRNRNNIFRYSVLKKTDNIKKELDNIQYEEMPIERLNKNGWNLVDKNTYSNLSKIESQFRPIKEFVKTGIATLKDDVYMVEKDHEGFYKIVNGKRYNIESGIVKTIYKVPELKKNEKLDSVCRHIIFPYIEEESGLVIIKEECLREKYPKTYEYLCAVKKELDSRDKGKKNPVAWYAYGRSQGLNKFGKKLLFPTFANIPKFMLVDDKTALFCNGYGVFENDYIELEDLMAILNSKIMKYYVENTSYSIEGGYYCYQKKYIEKFSIPWFTEKEKHVLRSGKQEEIDKMLMMKYDIAI